MYLCESWRQTAVHFSFNVVLIFKSMGKVQSKYLVETVNYSEEDAKFMMMAIK